MSGVRKNYSLSLGGRWMRMLAWLVSTHDRSEARTERREAHPRCERGRQLGPRNHRTRETP